MWLAYALLFYAGLTFVSAIAAIFLDEFAHAQSLSLYAGLLSILGAIIYFTSRDIPALETTRDAMVFLVLFWLFIPVVSAVPYLLLGAVETWPLAYFESVSAVTTTGASTLVPEIVPRSLLFMRSLIQWSGGVMVATFAVIILAALNLSGTGVHRSILFKLKKGELFSKLKQIGTVIAVLYLAIAFICFVLLVILGTPIFDAICLALSAVSTGGLVPRSGLLADYVSGVGGIVLAITCLLGAANISILGDIMRKRNLASLKDMITNIEHRGIFIIMSVFILFGIFYAGYMHFHTLIVESAFMVSTTGFDFHVIGVDILPPALLIGLSLVGGSALSTAGGIKIIRMLLLFHHMRTDLERMSHPSRVMPVRFQGQIIEDKSFLSVWMYFFAYTLVLAAGIGALGAAGMDLDNALLACSSALSNMGPLLTIVNPDISYAEQSPLILSILTIIMLLGRVEVLAAIAVLSPSLWQK